LRALPATYPRVPFWTATFMYVLLLALGVHTQLAQPAGTLSAVSWMLTSTTFLLYAGLSLVALWQLGTDRRVILFAATSLVVSLSLVLPDLNRVGAPWLVASGFLGWAVAYVGSLPVIVHLASEIPGDHPFVARHPRFVPLHYLATAVMAALVFGSLTATSTGPLASPGGFHLAARAVTTLQPFVYLYAGIVSLCLLTTAARHATQAHRRRQAFVVVAAMLVWTLNVSVQALMPALRHQAVFVYLVEPGAVLVVPIALSVAILGFHLFEISPMVRKTLVFGTSGLLLLTLLYLSVAVVVPGALAAQPWLIAAAFVTLAAAFHPLARWFGGAVDRAFFPEKVALGALQHSIISDLAVETNIEAIARRLVDRLVSGLDLTRAALLIADEDLQVLRVRAYSGQYADAGAAERVVVALSNLTAVPPALEATTVMPITFRERALGALCAGPLASGAQLDADDRAALGHILNQASAMLENARLFELAHIDPLTRLPRRHVFEERLRSELARVARSGGQFAVIIADIDHFKRLNDRYGHSAGDRVLADVAGALASTARTADLVARYGGEEFAILLPDTTPDAAYAAAERLRGAVADVRSVFPAGRASVTLSAGISAVTGGAVPEDSSRVIAAADGALYEAKRAGRNQTRLSDPFETQDT